MRYTVLSIVIAFGLTGCDQKPPPPQSTSPTTATAAASPPATPPFGIGRYTIIHSPQIERDTVLLDTVTGETWQMSQITDLEGQPMAWMPLYRTDDKAERMLLEMDHPPIAKKK